jgi:drug/metabolite transporter (DMT)-like permease
MLFVCLRALCNALFAQMLRLSQAKRPQTLGVITVNYGVATVVSLLLTRVHVHPRYLPPTVGLGMLGGVGYVGSILILMPAMRESGVSIAVAVLQLAILWPVAYAMVAFRELPSPAQWVGMAAAVAALILLSMGRTRPPERAAGPQAAKTRFSPLLPLLFCVTGVSGIAMKAFHEYAPAAELPGFMTVLFATATAGGALAMLVRRTPLRRADLSLGAAAGLPNAAQLEFIMRALEQVPALIAFPVSSALSLLLNTVASLLWWGERLDRPTALGLLLALVATVLLNRG